MSNFDEETKLTLSEWSTFDSLFKKITADYDTVFPQEAFDQQAEEVLEELSDIEEETFGDSTSMGVASFGSDSLQTAIPLEINPKVELAIKYFQTRGRKVFTAWLERTGRYEQLIRKILKEHGLPEELFSWR
jgi:membrane-bound lytic murein transglycosylase D